MSTRIRPVLTDDAKVCGRIIYEAFNGIADAHGVRRDFPSIDVPTQFAAMFIAHPSIFGVVAEVDGRVVGAGFVTERDAIRAVGPIAVDPAYRGGGIGRQIMGAVLERAGEAVGVRLVQEAFNTRSVALYSSLSFEVKEPLLLMSGTPRGGPVPGYTVRPLVPDDIEPAARICAAVHGVERSAELRDALNAFHPLVVEHDSRITGYATAPIFWPMNHGVAETEGDMQALIAAAAAASPEPVSFLLPVRQAGLFRWCLLQGMQVVKPMTLMTIGEYREPSGA
ncbi:GNAT family N-acetyltransferase [Paracraurococcus lichenis]|uniref:GNAT family N-acetyltransferase n=1 Tax=Paracraurococcus lichenis TaxID=3064888 RepID=A0ABT9EDD8_9PROT|nr:GNAT family N-acetyltransferase [Paracraurococcus sp. LOR1-02]MDO9714086.1 GNAT family N-acetyltransferase [Paracraurococcus sp. LOR1-02]